MLDETYFDTPPATAHAPLAVYPVPDPRPVERGESLADPLVVDGDNVGVVAAADAGLLQHNPTILLPVFSTPTPTWPDGSRTIRPSSF